MENINDIVNANLCLGCGLCTLNIDSEDAIELYYSNKYGHLIPKTKNSNSINAQTGYKLCPGKGYKINSLSKAYRLGNEYNENLGFYDNLTVVTSNEKMILKNASSSGIMTLLLNYLIENKIVDKAIVTKFEYTVKGPNAVAFITNKTTDLIEAQGSKYCPVDFSKVINTIKETKTKCSYAFVGTPCQIASLKYIQNNVHDLGIKYFIGNFCGGFKSYNNLKRIIKLNKVEIKDVKYFRFRGGGQPGSMMIQTANKEITIPYPNYVEMTGYSKVKRCHFCVDATAELADFSCGDAWLPLYTDTKIPTSIVITRTKEATEILERINETNKINCHSISQEDVIKSQIGNISTKKHRQFGRMKLYKLLGYNLPEIVEGFTKEEKKSLLFEFNVFISHRIKFLFEKLGLFYFFYYKNSFFKKVMFRLFRDNYN